MKHYIICSILGIISLILILIFVNTELFQILELKSLDYKFKWRPSHNVNHNIIIVVIDDNSISTIGRWPWSRSIHAALLKVFSNYPPNVIGFDLLFTEPEKGSREGDIDLAHYTRLLGNVIHSGYIRDRDNKPIYPIEEIAHAGLVGFINAPPDKDGIIRKVPLVIKCGKDVLPSFIAQVLCTYLNINFKDIKINLGNHISISQIGDIPIDKDGYMWINYVGDQHAFKEVAFQQILGWEGYDEKLKDFGNKLLLVGITATGLGDQGHIPIATNVPLIAVHANALNTILNKDFLLKMPIWINTCILVIIVILSTFINLLFRSIKAVLLSLFFVLLYIEVNLWLFQRNILLDILGPLVGFSLPFLLITIYRYGWEERQRRWIKKVFAHYLSNDVIDIVLRNPEKLKLGGELKTATVLYLDLRNFSGYCEGRPPEEVVSFLNRSFDWITEVILRNGGMLDKYVGDAIISLFGVPVESPPEEQTKQAVSTALEIVQKWYKLPMDIRCNMDIGIGINTGPMLIGNMGSRYIFNFTAVGDEVNITARIQGLTDEYKVNIIITDSVYNLIKDRFKAEPLGDVLVKGRKGSVKIYKVSY